MDQTHLKPKEFFEQLNQHSMHLVDAFYDEHVVFEDPLVQLKGRQDVKNYYGRMYTNVESISWDIPYEIRDGHKCALIWTMTLTAKNFNGNKPVVVEGVSILEFGGKEGQVIYHRDYFDMGRFVYENVPGLGALVRFVKHKMASYHGGSHQ
jgi:hypothetical protein